LKTPEINDTLASLSQGFQQQPKGKRHFNHHQHPMCSDITTVG
jgi:hypothetical protein